MGSNSIAVHPSCGPRSKKFREHLPSLFGLSGIGPVMDIEDRFGQYCFALRRRLSARMEEDGHRNRHVPDQTEERSAQ